MCFGNLQKGEDSEENVDSEDVPEPEEPKETKEIKVIWNILMPVLMTLINFAHVSMKCERQI